MADCRSAIEKYAFKLGLGSSEVREVVGTIVRLLLINDLVLAVGSLAGSEWIVSIWYIISVFKAGDAS